MGNKHIHATLHYPDLKGLVLPKEVAEEGLQAAANKIIELLTPQIPIDTSQLRRAFRWFKSIRVIRASSTKRTEKSARINNYELSQILAAKGYLNVKVTPSMRIAAAEEFQKVLRRHLSRRVQFKKFFTKARITLKTS